MFTLLPLEATSTQSAGSGSMIYTILLMVALFAGMYFLMIRPQKKQQKKEQEMRDSTQVGDEITTIGGIMGRVVTVKEDSLIIKMADGELEAYLGHRASEEAQKPEKPPHGSRPVVRKPKKDEKEQGLLFDF